MTTGASGSLFAVSAALLLLELYWLRAFAEAEWAHLASMVVSTALLGIGAGGTLVLTLQDAAVPRAARAGPALLALFVILAVLTPVAVSRLPLEPMLLAWRASAWGWVLVREALVALPFAAGAAFVALRFRLAPHHPARLYAVNLLGSATGIGVGLALMAWRPTAGLNVAAVLSGAAALALSLPPTRRPLVLLAAAAAAAGAAATSVPGLADTKDLAQALRLPQARILGERPGIPGKWTLLASPALHVTPGVSLVRPGPAPETRAIFVGGDLAEVAFAARDTQALRHRVSWLPYALRPPRSVLVLGEGGLLELQTAALSGAAHLVAIVPDPRTRHALRNDLGSFTGIPQDRLELRGGSARAALGRDPRRYDLVALPATDSFGSAAAGLGTTAENWLLTIEGLRAAAAATTDRGLVAVQRWTQAPPRDLPKLLATVVRAFDGAIAPTGLALVRNWDAWTLCASRTPFTPSERRALHRFASGHAFDVLLPQRASGAPVHDLPGPPVGPLLDSILATGGTIPEVGPLALEPATDDRPFFHHSLSYRHLGTWLALLREGAIAPSEWGDLFLAAGLLSAIVLGAIAIVAPALLIAGPRAVLLSHPRDTTLFAALGFGYMTLEILFLHQGTRLFGTAGPSAALTVAAFLLGSGLGSLILSRVGEHGPAGPVAAFSGAALAVALAVGLSPAIERLSSAPPLLAAAGFVGGAVLVAVPLGMPFPAGLARAGRTAPQAVPWLFAVNGWASVVGATASSLVAVIGGFALLGFAAAALYVMAGLLLAARASYAFRR